MRMTYGGDLSVDVSGEAPPTRGERVGDKLRRSVVIAICEALWEIESKAPESQRGPEWAIGPDGKLGPALLREAVAQTMLKVLKTSKLTIAKDLHRLLRKQGLLPLRSSKGSSATSQSAYWQEETFYHWLLLKVFPSVEDERIILEELLLYAGDKLAKRRVGDEGDTPEVDVLALADGRYQDPAQFVAALVQRVRVESSMWRPRSNYKPLIGPSFLFPPGAAQPESLRRVADAVRGLLVDPGGARTVVVEGPPQSGKKTTLRFLLRELQDHHLVQEDVCKLPVLAISVDDHTAEEMADVVLGFLSQSRPPRLGWDEDLARIDTREKLRRIRRLAARIPACVLLAEVENVEEDACIRGILGDVVGEILLSFMDGHDLTRVVLTSVGSPRSVYASQARRYAGKLVTRRLPREMSLDDVVGTPYTAELGPPRELRVSASAVRLSQAFMAFLDARVPSLSQRERLIRQCRIFLEGDRPDMIVALIHGRVLTANERLSIGLVASSQDGLRASVLRRMIVAISRRSPAWSGELPGTSELEGLLRSIGIIVRERTQANDRSLVAFGASDRELHYSIEDPWRRLFLERWWGEDAERARLAQWLIAREAAAQARLVCIHDPANRARGALGRDPQMIKALISSVDPAKAVGGGLAIEPIPAAGEEDVLPPLEVDAPVPDARAVLRFAFLRLYRRGMEGADYRLLTVGNEAVVRLEVLLPLFTPQTPWAAADGRGVARTMQPHAHLAAAFSPREILEMLASLGMASLRVRNYGLLGNCCRIGESVFGAMSPDDAVASYMPLLRLLRAEVDGGIFLGGNPDDLIDGALGTPSQKGPSLLMVGVQLSDVADRLVHLLRTSFAEHGRTNDDLFVARGKLYARLGEVRHLEGKFASAQKAFSEALSLERRSSHGIDARTVMGGRGVRSFLRYLLAIPKLRKGNVLWRQLIFGDELALPVPIRLKADDGLINEARKLHAVNVRRCAAGRRSEAIGIQIDEARLRAACHEYGLALTILRVASEQPVDKASSLELIFELHAIRTRLVIDAATLCLGRNAEDAVFHSDDAIDGIRDFLVTGRDVPALDLARRLAAEARGSLAILDRLVELESRVVHPYMIYARYLRGILIALESRLGDMEDVAGLLRQSKHHLEGAVRHMRETAYKMHSREAAHLLRSVERALAWHGMAFEPGGRIDGTTIEARGDCEQAASSGRAGVPGEERG